MTELFCVAVLAGFVLTVLVVAVACSMRSSQISRDEERQR